MDLQEFYYTVGGDYQDVKKRLINDEIIKKILKKYLDDDQMEKLEKSLNENNLEQAFISAHALKGICLNLGFEILRVPVTELVDNLKEHQFCGGFPNSLKETNQLIFNLIEKIE